jgi:hypothetical protein
MSTASLGTEKVLCGKAGNKGALLVAWWLLDTTQLKLIRTIAAW